MRIVFQNVRLFDPGSGIDAPGRTVVIEGGVLVDLAARSGTTGDRVFDGRGKILTPGLIDLRAQLCEPGFTKRETIASGTRAAARGGFTTVVMMPTTQPAIDRPEVVELIFARAKEAGATRVLPAGALSVDREGKRLTEMAQLAARGCVAFTDADRAVADSQLLRYALELASELNLPIFTHAEDESLSLGGVMHEGVVSTRLGLSGSPVAAEAVGISRDIAVAALTGARLHIGHVTTAEGIELIRQAKKRGVRVTAEAAPLYMLLTHEAVRGYDTRAKLWPPLRTRADVDAVIAGVADGTLDAIASDHVPHTQLDKNMEFDRAAAGAVGLETALPIVLELVRTQRLTLERAISALTRSPAQILGSSALGRIAEGGPADVTLIDLEKGFVFSSATSASRSSNSPLWGAPLTGRAVVTVAAGEITHEEP
ncbi:MAG: dihydroorotase [Myxococcota bacterium]